MALDIKHMLTGALGQRAGLFVSVMACAVVVYAHSKNFLNRHVGHPFSSELSVECGVESAWPHLRNDLAT